jgi:glycosyltransferase involved in cell wall biosynthesis
MLVAHDGADDPKTGNGPVPGTADGRLKVGYTGHLYPGRGIERIIELAAGLHDTEFHLFGGTERDVAYWKSHASRENLIFHGHVPPSEIAARQQGMDILLAPYQKKVGVVSGGNLDTSRYMSPLKIFEYRAAGKAIFCSELPALREIVDDTCAILVDPEDGNAWIAAMERLRDDPGLRAELGHRAREKFLAHHTWEKRAKFIAKSIFPQPESPATPPSPAPR